ncbi:unnamed protein product [Sphagnum balticum]
MVVAWLGFGTFPGREQGDSALLLHQEGEVKKKGWGWRGGGVPPDRQDQRGVVGDAPHGWGGFDSPAFGFELLGNEDFVNPGDCRPNSRSPIVKSRTRLCLFFHNGALSLEMQGAYVLITVILELSKRRRVTNWVLPSVRISLSDIRGAIALSTKIVVPALVRWEMPIRIPGFQKALLCQNSIPLVAFETPSLSKCHELGELRRPAGRTIPYCDLDQVLCCVGGLLPRAVGLGRGWPLLGGWLFRFPTLTLRISSFWPPVVKLGGLPPFACECGGQSSAKIEDSLGCCVSKAHPFGHGGDSNNSYQLANVFDFNINQGPRWPLDVRVRGLYIQYLSNTTGHDGQHFFRAESYVQVRELHSNGVCEELFSALIVGFEERRVL